MNRDPSTPPEPIDDRYRSGRGGYVPHALAALEHTPEATTESGQDFVAAASGDPQGGPATETGRDLVNALEQSPEGINYTGGGRQQTTGKGTWRGLSRRRKGAIGGLIGMLVGGGGLISVLFAPGMSVVYMQEVFSKDLDDISAGLDKHGTHVFKGRFANPGAKGFCGSKVTIRCKFTSTSGRQITQLERAGIKVECDGGCDKKLRNRVTAYTFQDGTRVTDPAKLSQALRSNSRAAMQMNKVFNARFFGMASSSAARAFKDRGLDKARKLIGGQKDKIAESLNKAVNGGKKRTVGGVAVTESTNDDGDKVYTDDSGKTYTPDELDAKNGEVKSALDKVRSSRGFGAAVKGVGIVGAVDGACTIYQTSRMVSLLAKAIRYQRLIVFAMAFMTTASAIRAGTATPEEVAFVGDKLTETDPRDTLGQADDGTPLKNPDKGKSATDSALWRLSQYGDVPNMDTASTSISSFMVGGSGAGMLSQIYEAAKGTIGGSPRDVCGVVQHPLTRIGSILVGVVASATPIGLVKLGVGVGAGFVVTEMAMGYLESMITEQAEDIDLNEIARYSDFSSAMFTGTSGAYGAVSASSGAAPLTDDTIDEYMAFREGSDADYQELKIAEASSTPFDVRNEFSFMGQVARKTAALTISSNGVLAKFGSLLSGTAGLVTQPAKAASYNPERFQKCNDDDYTELGIKADVMCNVRYGWTDAEMNMDNDAVVNYMVDGGYVNDDAPEEADLDKVAVRDTTFAKWVEHCAYRTTPYGEQGGEDDNDDWVIGKNCLGTGRDLDAGTLSYFKTFAARYTVIQSMDYGPGSFGGGSSEASPVGGELVGDKAYPVANGTHAGTYAGHHGVDFPLPQGSPIYAVAAGTVTFAGKESYGANVIFIMHEGGIMTQYAHMHDGAGGVMVQVGDNVDAGQQIGEVGNTGMSTGDHLHFEVNLNVPDGTKEMWNSTTAPYRWLKTNNIAPGPLHNGCGNCGGPIVEDDFMITGVYTS